MLYLALDLWLKCFACSVAVLNSGLDLAAPNDLQGIVLYISIQLPQHRLNYPKVGAEIFDSAWRIFDIIDGLDKELSALKSCRSDAYHRSGNTERVHRHRRSDSNTMMQ